jgi:hypothetical protein
MGTVGAHGAYQKTVAEQGKEHMDSRDTFDQGEGGGERKDCGVEKVCGERETETE